jgi:hypothetical protein
MPIGFVGGRRVRVLSVLALFMVGATGAFAARSAEAGVVHTFEFSGESSGGVGSATMDLTVQFDAQLDQWILTAVVNNTSPTTTAGGGLNMPGITAFGFELDPLVAWSRWTLEGQHYDSETKELQSEVLASDSTSGKRWVMDNSHLGNSVELSYIAQTDHAHFGALYNADLVAEGTPVTGGPPNGAPRAYYTTATLTMWFDDQPEFSFFPAGGDDSVAGSPYVRMMRVGDKQEGSLRLTGTELLVSDPGPIPGPEPGPGVAATPEPSSLLVWGGALAGLALMLRRRRTEVI